MIEKLRGSYDYILIDSAPVGMVSDTFMLARVSDATVYVTRANYTTTSSSAGQNSSEKSASDSKKPMACSHWAAGAVKYVRLCADTVAVVAGVIAFYFTFSP